MSYDPTLPTDKDTARFWLGDTGTIELLSDAQYDAVITLYGLEPGTAFLADGLVAQFAQLATSVSLPSGLSVTWAERIRAWRDLAIRLRGGQGLSGGNGGITMVPLTYGTVATEEFSR
jgi:hypothetical protein